MSALKGSKSLLQHPNLVLLHAGTNDADAALRADPNANPPQLAEPYDEMPKRLGDLIDMILCECPDAVVLVARIIQNDYVDSDGGSHQEQTDDFNQQIPGLVSERYKKGYKIRAVQLANIGGALLSDILHPNGKGYEAMADLWFDAIADIPEDWWSQPREPSSGRATHLETCAQGSTSFSAAAGGNNIAAGAHVDGDSGEPLSSSVNTKTWTPYWIDKGLVAIGTGHAGSGVVFADLNGRQTDGKLLLQLSALEMLTCCTRNQYA